MGKSLLDRACCAFYASFKEFISLVDDNDDNAHCAGDDDGNDEYGRLFHWRDQVCHHNGLMYQGLTGSHCARFLFHSQKDQEEVEEGV